MARLAMISSRLISAVSRSCSLSLEDVMMEWSWWVSLVRSTSEAARKSFS